MTHETGPRQDDDSASVTTTSAQASDPTTQRTDPGHTSSDGDARSHGTAPAPKSTGSAARPGPSRRSMLGGLASGLLAGGAAGLAGGIALGANSNPPQYTPAARQRFTGKTVLITGATSGIGAAAAHQFAAEGARVAFCGRREDRGRAVEREIRSAGGEATYFRADVRDEGQVRDFVDATVRRYGGLHVAFNNAGITIQKKLHEYSAEEFDQVLHTNLRGTFLAIKYQVPHLIRAGGGTIVVTSSSNALATDAARGAYTASKRGLAGLVQAAALDYAADNIRINTLIPGTTDTELVRRAAGMEALPDDAWRVFMKQWAASNVPGLGRLGTPDEIAAFALTLASDEHPYLTGAQLVIDGGKTAHA